MCFPRIYDCLSILRSHLESDDGPLPRAVEAPDVVAMEASEPEGASEMMVMCHKKVKFANTKIKELQGFEKALAAKGSLCPGFEKPEALDPRPSPLNPKP